MTYVITESCIDLRDQSCVEVCPVDCIYVGERMLFVHPGECIDCAACEPTCPVDAIFYAADLPGDLQPWEAINAAAFVGGAEGAREVVDPPAVRLHPGAAG